MFVPAFLDLTPCVQRRYIWHFFGAVNMQKKCHGPVIAPEEYFARPSRIITPDTEKAWANSCFANQNLPRDADLDKIRQCRIPTRLLDSLVQDFGSKSDAAVALYGQRIPALAQWFSAVLDRLQAQSAETVEALVLVVDIPSFSGVCRDRGIPVLYYEFGAFRAPTYCNVAYYSPDGVNIHLKLEKQFQEFQTQAVQLEPWERFTEEELLALFLVPEKLPMLARRQQAPRYEAGILAESTFFAPTQAVDHKNTLDLVDLALSHYDKASILVRDHPADPLHPTYAALQVAVDDSPSAADFLIQCRTILSRTSNSIVEAQLWGRNTYTIDPAPYGFACLSSLDETGWAPDPDFLNFMAFAFYFPIEFTYDIDYMRWRLTNPAWVDIYRRNLAYWLAMHGIPKEAVRQPGPGRLQRILQARQVPAGDPEALQRQRTELEARAQSLQSRLDDAGWRDVLCLQQTREKIRQIRVALNEPDPPPHLSQARQDADFWAESTLFWDTGDGFSQQACGTARLVCRRHRFAVRFEIPPEILPALRALRWDPLEGRPIAVTIDPDQDLQLTPMNASYTENQTDYFCSQDPMYRLTTQGQVGALQITGALRILPQPEVEWALCKAEEQKAALGRQVASLQAQLCAAASQRDEAEARFQAAAEQLETVQAQLSETAAALELEREPLYKKCLRKLRSL